MLLVAILRGLTSLLERVSEVLKESSRHWNTLDATSPDLCGTDQNLCNRPVSDFGTDVLGEYVIDSHEERDRMLCTLASLQINSLALLAQRLKVEAVMWNQKAHQGMICRLEDCFGNISSALKQIQQIL